MFWIHGGAFVIGAGSQSIYDGQKLARRGDVVVVTINYRLGVLGFLDLGQRGRRHLERRPARPGARARMGARSHRGVRRRPERRDDLRRVGGRHERRHAARLSGRARTLPQGDPAERRVPGDPRSRLGARRHARARCSSSASRRPTSRSCARSPVDKLLLAQQMLSIQLMAGGGAQLLPYQPSIDGDVLARHPLDLVREGFARDVRVLAGTTRDEWKIFGVMDPEVRQLDEAKIAKRLAARLPDADVAKIVAGYRAARPEADWASIWLAIETDRIFRIPAIRTAEAQHAHQRDVFMYLFSWESPGFGGILGACHAIEIAFVFGCLDLPGGENFVGTGPAADRLAELTMDAWLAFAKSGDPAHAGSAPGRATTRSAAPRWSSARTARCSTTRRAPSARSGTACSSRAGARALRYTRARLASGFLGQLASDFARRASSLLRAHVRRIASPVPAIRGAARSSDAARRVVAPGALLRICRRAAYHSSRPFSRSMASRLRMSSRSCGRPALRLRAMRSERPATVTSTSPRSARTARS